MAEEINQEADLGDGEFTIPQLRHRITDLSLQNHELRLQNHDLRSQNQNLSAENLQLRQQLERQHRPRRHRRTWPPILRQLIADWQIDGANEAELRKRYNKLYKLSYKEENMSSNPKFIHPNLCMQPNSNEERVDIPQIGAPEAGLNPGTFHSFSKLPPNVKGEIFKLWLQFDGRLVHCMSRLDPFDPPKEWPPASRSCLPNLFYMGQSRNFNITADTTDPNEVLGLLRVSKSFYFLGVHIFYGLNTFAFSSFGEFHRFCKGIGEARLVRIQNIELTWLGNYFLTMPREDEHGRPIPWFSKRSFALSHLPEMKRLQTLVTHINETHSSHIRRNYEPKDLKMWMAMEHTRGQPNKRMTRNLYTLQGLDYIWTLRGLKWFRVYDLQEGLESGNSRQKVFNTEFEANVSLAVTKPKVPSKQALCEVDMLPRLFNYSPQQTQGLNGRWSSEWNVVKPIYEFQRDTSFDEVRARFRCQDYDDVDDVRANENPPDNESDASDGSNDGNDDQDDGSNGGGGGDVPDVDMLDSQAAGQPNTQGAQISALSPTTHIRIRSRPSAISTSGGSADGPLPTPPEEDGMVDSRRADVNMEDVDEDDDDDPLGLESDEDDEKIAEDSEESADEDDEDGENIADESEASTVENDEDDQISSNSDDSDEEDDEDAMSISSDDSSVIAVSPHSNLGSPYRRQTTADLEPLRRSSSAATPARTLALGLNRRSTTREDSLFVGSPPPYDPESVINPALAGETVDLTDPDMMDVDPNADIWVTAAVIKAEPSRGPTAGPSLASVPSYGPTPRPYPSRLAISGQPWRGPSGTPFTFAPGNNGNGCSSNSGLTSRNTPLPSLEEMNEEDNDDEI